MEKQVVLLMAYDHRLPAGRNMLREFFVHVHPGGRDIYRDFEDLEDGNACPDEVVLAVVSTETTGGDTKASRLEAELAQWRRTAVRLRRENFVLRELLKVYLEAVGSEERRVDSEE